jgi:hypothetical protein
MVYTGQTAYCHGSPAATLSKSVRVAWPGVRVRCPKKAKPKPCKFKLTVLKKVGKGKRKRRYRVLSAPGRAKVKAGRTKIISLKAKKKYRRQVAEARKVLVKRNTKIGRRTTAKVVRLKVVR